MQQNRSDSGAPGASTEGVHPPRLKARERPVMPSGKKSSQIRSRMEQQFVLHYNGNALEAARASGYKDPKKAAFRLMRRERVTQAILAKQRAAVKAAGR